MKTRIILMVGGFLLLPWSLAAAQALIPETSRKDSTQVASWFGNKEQPKHETAYTLKSNWPPARREERAAEVAENLLARNFVLIFDGSGSMVERKCSGNRRKIDVAKEAASEWAKSLPEHANVGLVAFHNDTYTLLPLVGKSRADFTNKVSGITAGGGTPLGDAVYRAYALLVAQARRQLGYGEYNIVVVTDGEANNPRYLSEAVKAVLDSSPVIIQTIGFCIDEKHSLNQPGRTVYKTADNPESLRKGLQEVLAEAETFDLSRFDKP